MSTATLIPCPLCDTLPFESATELAEHLDGWCPARGAAAPSAPAFEPVRNDPVRIGGYPDTFAPVRQSAPAPAGPDGWHSMPAERRTAVKNPCTDKQVSFIRSLCDRTGADLPNFATLTKREASALIDTLKSAPAAPARPAAAPSHGIELEHGRVYAAADGTFIKVTESKAGNLYGKLLDEDGKFTNYEKGLLPRIARHLTAEEAATFGHLHKRCVFCSHNLSDEGDNRSVQVGYGETCAGNYGLPWG